MIARRLFRYAFGLGAIVGVVPFLATLVFLFTHTPTPPGQAAAVVVISGPTIIADDLQGETRARVDRGVALLEANHAPLIVMSGASSDRTARPVAELMGETALQAGVSEAQILVEPAARSTLQNAIFTADLPEIDPREPIILVTHRYHLPRAWASFRWAGFRMIALAAADSGPVDLDRSVWMEGIKWPFNIARALASSVALGMGWPRDEVLVWLQ